MQPKVLLIGPIPPPIHGESMALKSILDSKKINEHVNVNVINTSKKDISNPGKVNLSKLALDFLNIFKLIKWCTTNKQEKVYISISQTKNGLLRDCIFTLIAKVTKHKVITHLHGNNLGNTIDDFSHLGKLFIKTALGNIESGIVLGSTLEHNYRGYVKNIEVVSNGVSENFILKEELKPKVRNSNNLNIVYLSNLMENKGFDKLVTAVIDLLDEGYKLKLELAGAIEDSSLFEKIMQEVKFKGHGENISYIGVVKGDEKKQLLLGSDVMILPTNYKVEGQPLSIIEGMSAGLTIVSTNKGVIPDMISDCGIIIDNPMSIEQIKKSIKMLYNDEELLNNYSHLSRMKFEESFTESKYHEKILDLFLE